MLGSILRLAETWKKFMEVRLKVNAFWRNQCNPSDKCLRSTSNRGKYFKILIVLSILCESFITLPRWTLVITMRPMHYRIRSPHAGITWHERNALFCDPRVIFVRTAIFNVFYYFPTAYKDIELFFLLISHYLMFSRHAATILPNLPRYRWLRSKCTSSILCYMTCSLWKSCHLDLSKIDFKRTSTAVVLPNFKKKLCIHLHKPLRSRGHHRIWIRSVSHYFVWKKL